ncbi:amidase [Halobacillus locisalis]|uniref:Amidase n=1 Tax=Halobacillus locisalis TaxID=220753 RepID=A0A838CQI4_9BACI|nr:amidase family protein [Halobacillus locisalis]MBA2174221.1 amidase [Halobacillus locisalis]
MENWFHNFTSMQTALTNGKTTSKKLAMEYLNRIANYDQKGPNINAVMEINPDALHIAEALDNERKQKGSRGPMHGIPVIVKDNIDTGDKMHTTAGSVALKDHYAKEDAFVVKQLRKAGAVIIGKANLTEWANFMTEGMTNGYSSHGGQVLNPYGPGTFDVGGSSSGSAAAVASLFAAGAVGTETNGSILSPASRNSVVGLKPTVGLISRSGIIPISHSQDTAGPITRTVYDAALLLEALVGVDPKDSATETSPLHFANTYLSSLNTYALQGSRIGVERAFINDLSEEEKAVFDHALDDLKEQGAEIVEITLPNRERESSVMFHEFKNGLNAYLSRCEPHLPVHSLKELINYNWSHKEIALKYDQTLLLQSEETSGDLTDSTYLLDRLEDIRTAQTEGIDSLMKEHQLDALVSPNELGSNLPAIAGYPSITVPAGYTETNRQPVGLTLTSSAFQEAKLLSLAYHYEQTRSVEHHIPYFE